MPFRSLHRLILTATVVLFGGAVALTGPIGCSSPPKKVNLDAATNPNEEATRLEQDIKDAYTHHYDVLANSDFTSAQEKLAKGKREIADGAKNETILNTLGMARAYLNRAKDKADSFQDRAKGILEARTAALEAGAKSLPAEKAEMKRQDDDLRAEMDNLAKGTTSPERWSSLQKGYLAIQMHAIQDTKLGDAKARITSAVNNGARKNSPNALAQAERDVENAENVISANRNDNAAIEPAVQKANQSSQLLVEILSATKRPEGVINEDAAKAMVLQNRKLAAANTELDQVTDAVNAQDAQLKNAAATIKLNHALESARKEFTSDEADVYRQGDKLLIRLKAVNFPVGRADLPQDALPLLAKVKTIAEELNPSAVVVQGHTDSVGNKQLNKILSQNRADVVRDYLGENGLDKDKINAVGFGYEKPLSSNKSKQGRAENRRVDIVITPSTASPGKTL